MNALEHRSSEDMAVTNTTNTLTRKQLQAAAKAAGLKANAKDPARRQFAGAL